MKNVVAYSCPFVPAEWIAAHGMSPSRITSQSAGTLLGLAPGVCPYSHAFAEVASNSDAVAVIVTTACDQMRRTAEAMAGTDRPPVFLFNLPHTWQTPAAHKLYASELERLGRFLVDVGGRPPKQGELAEVMAQFDAARSALRDARGSLTPRAYSELITEFNKAPLASITQVQGSNASESRKHESAKARDGESTSVYSVLRDEKRVPKHSGTYHPVPVALIGGPLPESSFQIFDMIENAGGFVALDATETGERTMPAPFDRRRLSEDALGALTDAYFAHIPDPFRRPNTEFYKWLRREIAERGVRGLILRRYVWCDNWHAEAQRIKEWAGLPFLHIDVEGGSDAAPRTVSRIQAFFETAFH